MKNTLKKIAAAALAALMTVSFASCGEKAENDTGAKDGEKTYKVGIVKFVDDASLNQIQDNIQTQLDAKGSELNCKFDYADYTYNGQADSTTLNQIASELIAKEVDIIIPIATPTAQIMQAATEENQIPVVFSAVSDPVSAKLVKSMDAPGANITGTSDALNTKAILELMKAAYKDLDYVGLLYSNSEDSSVKPIAEAKEYFDANNIKYIEKTGTTTDELISAADALVAEGVDCVFTPTDNTVMTAELAIYEKFADAKIGHFCGADSFALNGAFVGYGVDYAKLGKATADMAVDVLVNGKKPAEMAVQTFDNGLAVVNTEICAALGFDMETVKESFKPHCTAVSEIKTAKEFEK